MVTERGIGDLLNRVNRRIRAGALRVKRRKRVL
jgi:hypothetical protein